MRNIVSGRTLLVWVLLAGLLQLRATATAQTLTLGTLQNNSSSAEFSDGINNSYDRQSALQLQSSAQKTFQVRYSSTLSCDSGAFGGNDTRTMSSSYSISFTVTAPVGYLVDVDTRRTGDVNVQYDGGLTGGSADISAITGSMSNATFVSGSLALPDPTGGFPDCNIGGGTTASCNVSVNQTGTARYSAMSNGNPVTHTLTFNWSQTTFTAAASGHEAAVRMGIQSRDNTNNASLYPGTPARNNQANDGHFIKVTVTSLCGNGTLDPGEQCDQGPANGFGFSCCSSSCTYKAVNTPCRLAVSGCDLPESCTGTSGACPADAIAPATVVCRAASSGQECDADEFCTGTSTTCPFDAVKPNGTVCRTAAGACDLAETCNGITKICPADAKSTGVCRAAAGTCDTPESCDGTSNACPPDVLLPSGVQCRPAGGACDIAETCSGTSGVCPPDAKSTALCRASAGPCDVVETCDGTNNACPTNAFLPATTVCRASVDACDAAELCTGISPLCPVDVLASSSTVCRAAAGGCDVAETCTGTSMTCPADQLAPASTVCRAAVDVCDVAETCSGTSTACPADTVVSTPTVCRAASGICDAAESCTGTSGVCPADGAVPNGTSCSNGLYCDGAETCQAGTCTTGMPPCAGGCDESSATCTVNLCSAAPLTCRTAGKSLLMLRNNADDNKDKLIWKWLRGESTTQSDFADPTSTADYALCIYAGGAQTLVAEIAVPPSASKWSPVGTVGYKYLDVSSSASGTQKVTLKGSAANKSKALLKGRGVLLPDPLNGGPLDLPVIAQLVNTQNQVCWGADFPSAKRNTMQQFKSIR